MGWRLAYSLEELRSDLNARWPDRDKHSDGTIGDASHAASASDHNPNAAGVVCAFDIDTDLDGTDDSNDPQMAALVEYFRQNPHPDVKYVIYNHRVFRAYDKPGIPAFSWAAYTGSDPHTNHAHVSVGVGSDGHSAEPYDDRVSWLPPLVVPVPREVEVGSANLTTSDGHWHFFGSRNGTLYEVAWDGKQWLGPFGLAFVDGLHDVSASTPDGVRIDVAYVDKSGHAFQGFWDAASGAWVWSGSPPGIWD